MLVEQTRFSASFGSRISSAPCRAKRRAMLRSIRDEAKVMLASPEVKWCCQGWRSSWRASERGVSDASGFGADARCLPTRDGVVGQGHVDANGF